MDRRVDYIELLYNPNRRRSRNDQFSLAEYEWRYLLRGRSIQETQGDSIGVRGV